MTVLSMPLPIAITQGDPAGIGPEIIVKAFRDSPDVVHGCFVVGDMLTLRRAASVVADGSVALPIAGLSAPVEVWRCPPRCIPLWALPVANKVQWPVPWGQINAQAGQMAGDCVVWAAKAALRGEVSALVTAPINKAALALADNWLAQFPGHTEMLQALAANHLGQTTAQLPVRMMLANDALRVVLVSIHLSLRSALEAVTFENVLQSLLITHQSLQALLGRVPHIGVAGLNPHAGECGLFGMEEVDIIAPAILAAQQRGLQVSGPFAPDTVFMRARTKALSSGEFDVVLAMYHDQGLIPVKYLGVEKGVNVTLGLPMVRTSPDHGTAFDMAGTGCADASSLIESIRTAKAMVDKHAPITSSDVC